MSCIARAIFRKARLRSWLCGRWQAGPDSFEKALGTRPLLVMWERSPPEVEKGFFLSLSTELVQCLKAWSIRDSRLHRLPRCLRECSLSDALIVFFTVYKYICLRFCLFGKRQGSENE